MDHVDRIMLFASMRSGKVRYNIHHLRVPELLQHVRGSLASLLVDQGFAVEEVIDPDLPCVLGDQLAVCSCLENLITNAIKYGGGDRRIRIRATAKGSDRGRDVAISVEDKGMGIHTSELKHIFEPFYRTREAAQAHIPGTGLGLSVSKHLAEAMGGRLSVRSEVGVGSTFTLHLLAVDSTGEELAEVGAQQGERS
jgi:signal transduction histidine kinase